MTIPARRPSSQHPAAKASAAAGRVPRRRSALSRIANVAVDHIVDTAPGAFGRALDALLRHLDRLLGTPVPPAARAAADLAADGPAPANPARRRGDVQAPPARPKTFTTDPDGAVVPAPTSSAPAACAIPETAHLNPTGPNHTGRQDPTKPIPRSALAKHLGPGQHIVRATCTDCGDVEIASSEVHLVVYKDDLDQSWYGFACPACDVRNIKFASLEARKSLIEDAAVTATFTTTRDDPNGTGRTPEQAARAALNDTLPPLTTDDVLDAALWLNTVDDIAAAARTTDLTDGGTR